MTARWLAPLLLSTLPLFAVDPTGLPDFHQVDDHVYRGRQPRPEGYKSLAQMGVKTIIDLRGGWLHVPHERKEVEAAGMKYVEERFSGIFAPKDQQVARLLAVMQDPSAGPVFVHCRRGADRVGVLIACYRMVHDHWTTEQAMAEARDAHLSVLEVLMRRYIRNFDPARFSAPAVGPANGGQSPFPVMFDFMLGN